VRVRETVKIPAPTMTEPMNDGLVMVDDVLIANPVAAPELIARVRASLRAMKITRMRRSRFDAQ
jgi:DNA-binding response OmpR family regulator